MDYIGGTNKAQHLCVLVHGLWGNPNHLNNVAKTLRSQYSRDELYLLLPKRNSGNFTYDGIELGGERVCAEIEEELHAIEERGGKITKLSVIGYSLGGLVSRYAIGLLEAKGILDTVECMNFATFASPHLGVRTPLKGWHNHIWNVLGGRMLSESGRQLFTIDNFRDTGRPLLAVLADPKSIFMSGLRRFKQHTLFTNIVNDLSAVHYTTGISKTDPYVNLDQLELHFAEGCSEALLDPDHPFTVSPKLRGPTTFSSAGKAILNWIKKLPFLLAVVFIVPIGLAGFVINSGIQTILSSKRIRLHEKGLGGLNIADYRVPLWIKEMRDEVEHVFETLNSSQNQQFLTADDDDDDENMDQDQRVRLVRERRQSMPSQPTLALAPCQFEMIDNLDTLKWRKYPVWIRKIRHSHAAMIVRRDAPGYEEGWTVLKHYATKDFVL